MEMKVIARIHSEFPEKFGIPRQPGLVDSLKAYVVFEEEYRDPAALMGLEGYSHIWLIWEFSEAIRETWSPTVHPPRLGGKKKMGVFGTRSPFRPNPLGLSCVKLEAIEKHPEYGMILRVTGADLMDQTPIYDIKPYLPYSDSHPEAEGGFAEAFADYHLEVVFPEEYLQLVPEGKRQSLLGVLAQDPRPSYQKDPERIYGVAFGEQNIRFRVQGKILTVCGVEKYVPNSYSQAEK